MDSVLQLIREKRAAFLDRLVARIVEQVPRYGIAGGAELRANAAAFFEDILGLIAEGEKPGISDRQLDITRKRIEQGFTASDYLLAILIAIPVLREFVREMGPTNEPSFARDYAQLEAFLQASAAGAANVYVEAISRRLESKNQELNALNQRLRAHEKALALEAQEAGKSLMAANEFNRRIIESLSSGLMVVQTQTQKVTFYSSRMEEILAIPTESVVGKHVAEAMAGVEGLPLKECIETVRALGRLPVSKFRVRLPNGRWRAMLVRAQRMYDENGMPEGTVVVADDVTERELLVDSFSRYVSRDLVQRLIARGEGMGLEGERRTCTIFFADIRGFTSLAENLSPEELHALLNDYFRLVIGAIVDRGGFIDKFVGDKVMALFMGGDGAPAALDAAGEIQQRLRALNRERRAAGRPPIDVGIGVNTGEVMLGNVGTEERMDFTAIGDAVNVADRLQSIARAGEVVVGHETAKASSRHRLQDRGDTTVKGRTAPLRVFALEVPEGERPSRG